MAGGDKGGSQSPRCTGEALERRLDAVGDLILQGFATKDIYRACAVKWELSARQTDTYVKRVHERWKQEAQQTRADARVRQVRRLMRVYRKADEAKDYKTCLRVEDLLIQVEGTEYKPSDDIAQGGAEIVIERRRNPDVPEPGK